MSERTGRLGNEDRAREGLDHLQAAALELIAASRAFLDVAEELVREPAAAATLLRAAAGVAAAARHEAARDRTGAAADSGADAEQDPARAHEPTAGAHGAVRRIHVS